MASEWGWGWRRWRRWWRCGVSTIWRRYGGREQWRRQWWVKLVCRKWRFWSVQHCCDLVKSCISSLIMFFTIMTLWNNYDVLPRQRLLPKVLRTIGWWKLTNNPGSPEQTIGALWLCVPRVHSENSATCVLRQLWKIGFLMLESCLRCPLVNEG